MRNGLAAVLLALSLAGAARAQENEAPDAGHEPPRREGLSLGSPPGRTLEVSALVWVADLKDRSHFGFDEHGSRAGEVAYVLDLGHPEVVPVPGFALALSLGSLGWVGGELAGFGLAPTTSVLGRLRRTNEIDLAPGDVVRSEGSLLLGRALVGWELRERLLLDPDWPLDLACSPTLGFAVLDLDVELARLAPSATGRLGGHLTGWTIAPGFQVGIELAETVRLGLELEEGLPFPLTTPHLDTWQRVRALLGVRVLAVEATVGWRMVATHASGDGSATDLRLRGIDFTLGVRF